MKKTLVSTALTLGLLVAAAAVYMIAKEAPGPPSARFRVMDRPGHSRKGDDLHRFWEGRWEVHVAASDGTPVVAILEPAPQDSIFDEFDGPTQLQTDSQGVARLTRFHPGLGLSRPWAIRVSAAGYQDAYLDDDALGIEPIASIYAQQRALGAEGSIDDCTAIVKVILNRAERPSTNSSAPSAQQGSAALQPKDSSGLEVFPAGQWDVHVVTSDGAPVVATLEPPHEERFDEFRGLDRIKTDAQGVAHLTRRRQFMGAARPWLIMVSSGGYEDAKLDCRAFEKRGDDTSIVKATLKRTRPSPSIGPPPAPDEPEGGVGLAIYSHGRWQVRVTTTNGVPLVAALTCSSRIMFDEFRVRETVETDWKGIAMLSRATGFSGPAVPWHVRVAAAGYEDAYLSSEGALDRSDRSGTTVIDVALREIQETRVRP